MKIYVGNMSFDSTQDSLESLFSNYGEVQEVAVITDRETGRPRGFAFVTMDDNGGKEAIAALNESETYRGALLGEVRRLRGVALGQRYNPVSTQTVNALGET